MRRFLLLLAAASSILLQACSEKTGPLVPPEDGMYDRVLILYAAGFNSLSSDIRANISDAKGTTPNLNIPDGDSDDAFLIVSHNSLTDSNFSTQTSPHVVRVTRDFLGRPVADTLRTLDPGTSLMDKDSMKDILGWIRERFPSKHYGMILSSHGTGWLPEGYYANPNKYEGSGMQALGTGVPSLPLPSGANAVSEELDNFRQFPKVRSFGEERRRAGGLNYCYEMDIRDMAQAIPMHLDYMIFDACLMGGVEVAFELRKVTDYLCFSPTEVLAGGYDYTKIVSRLLGPGETDLVEVCRDFYNKYAESSTPFVTVTCLSTARMDELASVCRGLFAKYRTAINSLSGYQVQGYYRSGRHYFYDFVDIIERAGATEEERISVRNILMDSIPFRAFTREFIEIKINRSCGLSMYLPSQGSSYLDDYYRNLSWNLAAGLVE